MTGIALVLLAIPLLLAGRTAPLLLGVVVAASSLFFLAQWGRLRSAPADSHLLPRPHWTRAVLIPMIALSVIGPHLCGSPGRICRAAEVSMP